MHVLDCSGSPYEIGIKHGTGAKQQVLGSLKFYQALFVASTGLGWPSVLAEASQYVNTIEQLCPRYLEEMRGIAEGAGVDLLDIVALNVRTEIMFGLFTQDPTIPAKSDGCTSLAIKTGSGVSYLAQNWDWQVEQSPNLVVYHVSQPGTGIPRLSMVTEAGVIGKIGLNEEGVGVCLNAIRARGVDRSKLPVHLALRTVLESKSAKEAVSTLERLGVAGSAHILVADSLGSTGLECTIKGIKRLSPDDQGVITHSNHLLLDHEDVEEPPWLTDSPQRVQRIRQLVDNLKTTEPTTLFELFKDEDGYPAAINRQQKEDSEIQTLFNIIMNLSARRAQVKFGRPTEDGERVDLKF